MDVLIDSSILIENERRRLDLEQWISTDDERSFFISVVTASELLHGVHRAADPAVRARRSAWVEAMLERFPLLPIDLVAARVHSALWAELASRGALIGAHDLWLAASCVAHGLTMVTANVREFSRVPGLVVERWEQ